MRASLRLTLQASSPDCQSGPTQRLRPLTRLCLLPSRRFVGPQLQSVLVSRSCRSFSTHFELKEGVHRQAAFAIAILAKGRTRISNPSNCCNRCLNWRIAVLRWTLGGNCQPESFCRYLVQIFCLCLLVLRCEGQASPLLPWIPPPKKLLKSSKMAAVGLLGVRSHSLNSLHIMLSRLMSLKSSS